MTNRAFKDYLPSYGSFLRDEEDRIIIPIQVDPSGTGTWVNRVLSAGDLLAHYRRTFLATAAPTINDDEAHGFLSGDRWVDESEQIVYDCADAAEGSALWLSNEYLSWADLNTADADTPLDADKFPFWDIVDAALKSITWANIKAALWTALGGLINGGTSKSPVVDADMISIADSAASNATKKSTFANLWTYYFKGKADALYSVLAHTHDAAYAALSHTHTVSNITDMAEGSWTPTVANGTNVAASTAIQSNYTRIGSRVRCFGRVVIDPTSTGATDFTLTLPIASAFANAYQAQGTLYRSGAGDEVGYIESESTNDVVKCLYTATNTSNHSISFSFDYLIV